MRLSDDIDLGAAVVGGVIIGISSTGFLIASGKLTGISGFVENTITPKTSLDKKLWVWSYIIGLMLAGFATSYVDKDRLGITSEVRVSTIVGGLFVGLGTRMGCGCTSGHGISGLPRGSLRALVAVSTFMAVAVVSAICTRHLQDKGVFPEVGSVMNLPHWDHIYVVVFLPVIGFVSVSVFLYAYYAWITPPQQETCESSTSMWEKQTTLQHASIALIAGFVFGVGLAISQMCDPKRVTGFLDFVGPDGFDPSLAGVMIGAVIFNSIAFHFLSKYKVNVLVCEEDDHITLDNVLKMWKHPANMKIDSSFVAGAVFFGLGWGMAGICPGPALVNLAASSRVSAAFIPFMLVGMMFHEIFKTSSELKKRVLGVPSAVEPLL